MKPFHSLPSRANYLNSLAGDNPDHLYKKAIFLLQAPKGFEA